MGDEYMIKKLLYKAACVAGMLILTAWFALCFWIGYLR